MRQASLSSVLVLTSPLLAASCDRREDRAPPPPTSATATPFAGDRAYVVGAREDVPLTGPRVDARPGDYLLRSQGLVAVVDASRGRIVDLGFEGKDDGLVYIEPGVLDGFDLARADVEHIGPGAGPAEVIVRKRLPEKDLRFQETIRILDGRLTIETQVENAGAGTVRAAALGETVHFGNSPTFVEGHGYIEKGGSYGGRFTTIATPFQSYAICKSSGALFARFSAPEYAGAFTPYRSGEAFAEMAPGARTEPRVIQVVPARDGRLDAAVATCAPATRRIALPAETSAGATVEVARCKPGTTDVPGERYLATPVAAGDPTIALPAGCFVVRLTRRAHAPGPWAPADDARLRTRFGPEAGSLSFEVRERGELVPAKITLLPVAKEQKLPDLGLDPELGVAQNAIYSLEGEGTVRVPPGEYDVVAGRGPEHTEVTTRIRVEAAPAPAARVVAEIARVVDTTGYTSADLHVHAIPSFDSPVKLADRLRSLVAVDVDAFAATDHNRVTDYAPVITDLGLGDRIASIVGDEVTTTRTDFGHFNAFPLPAGSPPLPFDDVTPRQIVQAARQAGALLQVNHPRMGRIGYFELLRFDPRNAGESLARASLFDRGFDAIEVFNGDDYADADTVERVLADWFALLREGVRVTATGNSDSHRVSFQEAGTPRNWIRMPDRAPGQPFDQVAFVDAVRRGRVVVSSGPFVTLRVGNAEIGDTTPAGEVEVSVVVAAPPWVDVSRVDLVQTGEVVHTWRRRTGEADAKREDQEPAAIETDTRGFAEGVRRFEAKLPRTAKPGDFFVVIVRGETPMKTLSRKDAKPFAFTNPVFVE